jgi:hypothetical protein
MGTEISKREDSIFTSMTSFEQGLHIAKTLSSSNIIPQAYQNNIQNTMVALEMANRIGISPLMVMQNLDVIQGKPSWRSTFIIASLNSTGRFKPLKFEFVGNDTTADNYGCRAYTTEIETGEKLSGPLVTWAMVKAEGWLNKSGSKWKTMPELMFQYRAASFFGRLYAPEILNGMQSIDEVVDVVSTIDTEYEDISKIEIISELLSEVEHVLTEKELSHVRRVIDNKEANSYDKAISFLEDKKTASDDTQDS